MKYLFILLTTLFSLNIYSQAHVGVMGGFDLKNEYSKLGVGLNYMPLSKVMIGGGLMITPFDVDDDYEIMLNIKYNLGRFNVAAGYMFHEMPDDPMGMHMTHENNNEPYIGIDYKLFKNKKLKVYYNHSESMSTFGLMLPIFNIGKKMHMNHDMDHSNHN